MERAFQLLKPNGVLGLLVPSEIASDQSSSGFFRKVSSGKRIKTIIELFNRKRDGNLFFPDVYYRYKFCAYVVGADHFSTSTRQRSVSLLEMLLGSRTPIACFLSPIKNLRDQSEHRYGPNMFKSRRQRDKCEDL